MQYNLVKNSMVIYSIKDLFGLNRILGNDEMSYLSDEDLGPTNVVEITNDETISLIANFGRRIKIDGIRLYIHSATVSGVTTSGVVLNNIDFYYKNYEEDGYTVLNTKYVGDDNFYYSTLPFPSAPYSTKITISGVTGNIAEYSVFNDEYSVAFGEDGTLQKKYIVAQEDTTNWETQSLAIYNNGTNSVQEYISAIICIDYTGDSADNYLKISSEENGQFIGMSDGVLLQDNYLYSKYIWDMGKYWKTEIVNDTLVLEEITDLTSYYKLGTLPFAETMVGDSNFALDEVNRVMYVLVTGIYLTLYKYFYTEDTWEYLGKVNPGCTGFENYANICYLNGYAYILYNNNPNSFGRYEIDGDENNWEMLSNLNSPTFTDPYKFNIISDNQEYIYGISYAGHSESDRIINPDGQGWFARYSTISGSVAGWEILSNQYYHEESHQYYIYTHSCALVYNKDDVCIYLINGLHSSSDYDCHIQKYDIITDTWDGTYINMYEELPGIDYVGLYFCYTYYDNFLYFYNTRNKELSKYDLTYFNSYSLVVFERDMSGVYNTPYIVTLKHSYYNNIDPQIFILGPSYEYNSKTMTCYDGIGMKGTYTTPIFELSNAYASSYFLIDSTFDDNTMIKYDPLAGTHTIQIQSGDYGTLQYDYVLLEIGGNLDRFDLYTDLVSEERLEPGLIFHYHPVSCWNIDNRNSNIIIAYDLYQDGYRIELFTNNYGDYALRIEDDPTHTYRYSFSSIKFDSKGGIWCYGYTNYNYVLWHFNSSLNLVVMLKSDDYGIYSDIGQRLFVYDYCKGEDGSVWYTHEGYEKLYHLDEYGNSLWSKIMDTPTFVTEDGDGGVWVVNNDNKDLTRYNSYHNKEITFSFSAPIEMLSADLDGGVWYINGTTVHYMSSSGNKTFGVDVGSPYSISGGHGRCVVYNRTLSKLHYVSAIDGIIKTLSVSEVQDVQPLYFSYNLEDMKKGKTNYLPVSYDPHWGNGGDFEWVEIPKDGYFMPKNKYHRLKFTLRSQKIDHTPHINKITMAPSIRLQEIKKGEYKNMYLKSEVPIYERNQTYNTKLKCWWEDKE